MNVRPLMPLFGSLLLLLAPAVHAQDPDTPAPPKAKREVLDSLGQISVVDKLLGLEANVGPKLDPPIISDEQWAKFYKDLYRRLRRDVLIAKIPGAGSNDAITALALGIRASDGVVALKAHDAESLNACAEQMEQLAVKLGATQREFRMSANVKQFADNRRWLDAFLALGFLQRDVLHFLRNNEDKKNQATLVIVGGWLQAGRYVTEFIRDNYSAESSNILREPRFVDSLKLNIDRLDKKYRDEPVVRELLAALPDIKAKVDVGLHDPVSKEHVEALHAAFEKFVLQITPEGELTRAAQPAGAEKQAKSVSEAGTTAKTAEKEQPKKPVASPARPTPATVGVSSGGASVASTSTSPSARPERTAITSPASDSSGGSAGVQLGAQKKSGSGSVVLLSLLGLGCAGAGAWFFLTRKP